MHHRVLPVMGLILIAGVAELRAADDAPPELVAMLVELLANPDQDMRALALDQIRTEAPGEAATGQFAAQLPHLSTEAQIGLLGALADRGDPMAKPAVTTALGSSSDASLQIAAIRALGKLGDASDLPKLLPWLAASDSPLREATRRTLVQLRGKDAVTALVNAIESADAATQVTLIEILAERRAIPAIGRLLDLAVGEKADLRAAAMAALGKLAGPEHVGGMAQGVLAAAEGAERAAAEKNLMFVCNRIKDKNQRAQPLLDFMQTLEPSDEIVLLSTLGRVGGTSARADVDKAISSPDPALHAAGIRAISNWPDASVADQLIDLAESDAHETHRREARKALVRIAPLPDGRTDLAKLDLLTTAFKLAETDAERRYALQRAAAIRIIGTLRFVLPYVDQPDYAQQACQSVVELAHHRQLRDQHREEFHAALDKVRATTQDPVLIERATRYQQGQTWVRPKSTPAAR